MLFAFFFTPAFAIAGLLAATGPVIIHLLNRRRYRTVHWAAMDFLREAIERNRRILQLRDWLLLALRTLCVLLFGLAMARPYWSRSDGTIDPDQPVHAVLIVDNSLSMAYARLDGTLLDEARARASEFVQRLPAGSRISVIPLCGASDDFTLDPLRTKEDAQRALRRIEIVDRGGSASQAVDLALAACQQAPDVPAKRVVFLGDQQAINWPAAGTDANLKQLPEMQIVQISGEATANAWIADFRLQDGIADVETSALLMATIRYEGESPRDNVPVTLSIDGVTAASKIVSLEPGQTIEVSFPYRFDVTTEPGQATFVSAEVALPPDRLPEDDRRGLMTPVVAALPVVFVDQWGQDEDPQKNQYGETFLLRRLLAPVTTRGDFGRQLIQIRHARIEQLSRDMLEDARLVVIAGVPRPDAAVPLLRQYMEQGGQLVIAAGAGFDPQAWQQGAWLDGAGILAAPLASEPVGRLPSEAGQQLHPFQLDFASLSHDYFLIENEDREALADLYGVPLFFKTIVPQVDDEVLEQVKKSDTARRSAQRQAVDEVKSRLAAWQTSSASQQPGPSASAAASDEERLAELEPSWLLWNLERFDDAAPLSPADVAELELPRVLARYGNKIPFMVQRRLGRGQTLLVSSGVFTGSGSATPGWTNLATTDAVLLFDRVFRSMLKQTLPERTLEGVDRITLPVAVGDRRNRFTLARPEGGVEPLSVDALTADRYGITVRNITRRGTYQIAAHDPDEADEPTGMAPRWEVALAVNGPAEESQLAAISPEQLEARLTGVNYRWVPPSAPISLEGAEVRGQDLWRWFMAALVACLLAELVVLAWPVAKGRAA
jgi:hypothetical protein